MNDASTPHVTDTVIWTRGWLRNRAVGHAVITFGLITETMWDLTMTERLKVLIARTRTVKMDEAQRREQRLSFVYGNTHIENERITRDIVAEADARVVRRERDAVIPRP